MGLQILPLTAGGKDAVRADAIDLGNFERELTRALERADEDGVDDLRDVGHTSLAKRWDASGVAPLLTLTDRLQRILDKPYAAAEGLDARIIPQRQVTPVGEEFVEIGRADYRGQVKAARSAGSVPLVDVSLEVERFRSGIYVCAFKIDQWERTSAVNRLFSIAERRANAARQVQALNAHTRVWDGDSVHGLPGVLNHPYIPVKFETVNYLTGTPDNIIDGIAALRHYAADNNSDVGNSNALRVASKLSRSWASRRLTDTGETLLSFIQKAHPDLEIVPCHSLNGAGPNGEHGFLFFNRDDDDSLFHDMIQPTTFLAPQTSGFEDIVYCWMQSGGVHAYNSFHNLIAWSA